MASLVSLPQIKAHLRYPADDEGLLALYADAAEEHVLTYCNRSLPWLDEAGQETDVPRSVIAAALLVIGDLYENREAQTDKPLSINATVRALLQPHRLGVGI